MTNKRKLSCGLLAELLLFCLCCLLLVLTPACATQPAAPENIEAMRQALREYGRY